jgi:glycosyltransferase involved in cell wall biosynthesis
VDRHMSPHVTYWTGVWRPGLEAISNEVATLRNAIAPDAPLVSFSRGQSSALLWGQRAIRLSANRWIALRATAAALEPFGDVTHVWGAIDDWHFLRCLGRKPMVLTVALPGTPLSPIHYERVRRFAAETESLAAQLTDIGIPADAVRVVYPGVDLDAFAAHPAPPGRFRLLFASSPSDVAEFAARGIPLLVGVAKARPETDVVLLWRNWGNQTAAAKALADLDPPPNLLIEALGDRTMPEVFRASHAVACLYKAGFGKSCPNSVVESLACGRPVLVSTHCGIADLVSRSEVGCSVPMEIEEAAAAVDQIQADWPALSARARALAVQTFDVRRFIADYQSMYSELCSASVTVSVG